MPFDYNLTASEYSIYPQSRNDVDVHLAAKRTSQAEMVNYTQTRQEAWLKEVVETGISRSFEGAMAQLDQELIAARAKNTALYARQLNIQAAVPLSTSCPHC